MEVERRQSIIFLFPAVPARDGFRHPSRFGACYVAMLNCLDLGYLFIHFGDLRRVRIKRSIDLLKASVKVILRGCPVVIQLRKIVLAIRSK
jgi:hypothetical protein